MLALGSIPTTGGKKSFHLSFWPLPVHFLTKIVYLDNIWIRLLFSQRLILIPSSHVPITLTASPRTPRTYHTRVLRTSPPTFKMSHFEVRFVNPIAGKFLYSWHTAWGEHSWQPTPVYQRDASNWAITVHFKQYFSMKCKSPYPGTDSCALPKRKTGFMLQALKRKTFFPYYFFKCVIKVRMIHLNKSGLL